LCAVVEDEIRALASLGDCGPDAARSPVRAFNLQPLTARAQGNVEALHLNVFRDEHLVRVGDDALRLAAYPPCWLWARLALRRVYRRGQALTSAAEVDGRPDSDAASVPEPASNLLGIVRCRDVRF